MIRVMWSGRAGEGPLRRALGDAGIEVVTAPSSEVVATIVVTASRAAPPGPLPAGAPWVWLAAGAVSAEDARAATAAGAYDVLDARAADVPARLITRVRELAAPEPEIPATARFVADSEAARAVLRQIARAARTSMPVLLTGETGTGKEVAARLLHEWSERRARRFMPINCAAIPNELIEAELFGYAKGAFTGSVRAYDGQLVAAEGGTVLLDEVDDTPLPFQVKLLRVLEDRVVSRLGDNDSHVVNFRILAATNRDLRPLCEVGAFGSDLYERLAIVSIRLPPLRERLADLPSLALHMIERFYKEEPAALARHAVASVSDAALDAMRAYPWPGNIRELRNAIFEALVGKRAGTELLLADLPARVLRREGSVREAKASVPQAGPNGVVDDAAIRRAVDEGRFDLQSARESLERVALEAALARAGNAAAAAQLLGRVGRGAARDPGGTVRAMMRRLGLSSSAPAPRKPRRRRRSR